MPPPPSGQHCTGGRTGVGIPGGMADLAALLALVAAGWFDRLLLRWALRRGPVLAVGAAVLGVAFANIELLRPVPTRLNLGGALLLALAAAAAAGSPRLRPRIAAAAGVATCFLFGLHGLQLPGPLGSLALPAAAGAAAGLLAGGQAAVLGAAAAPMLADLARWAVELADGLPATVSLGAGGSFTTAVLAATVAAAVGAMLPTSRRCRPPGPSEAASRRRV